MKLKHTDYPGAIVEQTGAILPLESLWQDRERAMLTDGEQQQMLRKISRRPVRGNFVGFFFFLLVREKWCVFLDEAIYGVVGAIEANEM